MRLTVVSCLLLSSSGPACAFVPHRTPVSSSTRTSDGSKQALLLSATNSISIDEGTPRDIGSMDEWATMCQVQRVEGFQLSPNDESGLDWSVYTNQDIAANSPVLFVPSNMILSSTRLRHELGDPVLNESIEYLSRLGMGDQVPQFILFVKLLLEYQQGDQSPYFPWLNSLPRLYYNAVSMTSTSSLILFFGAHKSHTVLLVLTPLILLPFFAFSTTTHSQIFATNACHHWSFPWPAWTESNSTISLTPCKRFLL